MEVHRSKPPKPGLHKDLGLWVCVAMFGKSASRTFRNTPVRYLEYYSLGHMHRGKSTLWFQEDNKRRYIKPGQAILIPPNYIHRYGRTSEDFSEDIVCFAGPIADALFKYGIIRTGIYDISSFGERPLKEIIECANNPLQEKQLEGNIKLLEFLYRMNRYKTNGHNKKYSKIDDVIEKTAHGTQHWRTVTELAEYCGYSLHRFRRIFKKRTGMLPKEYLDQIKINEAKIILLNDSASIAEIAERLGFVDQFHFAKRFKQKTGYTPSAYRLEFSPPGSGHSSR